MLYFLYGNRQYIKNESIAIRSALLKKRPDAISLSFDESTSSEISLDELANTQGLFQSRYIIEFDGLFAAKIFQKEKEAIERLAHSDNIFLVLEEKIPKKIFDSLKKNAEKTSEEKATLNVEKKEFSAFSLADALAGRDKKKLWVLFRESIARKYVLEELHGILFWQAKMLVLAHKTNSPDEAGVSPYPYNKARAARENYSLEEAEILLHSFSEAILESRAKNISLEHSLEKVILTL